MTRAALVAIALGLASPIAAAKPDAGLVDELAAAGAAEAPIVVRVDAAGLAAMRDLARTRVPSFVRGAFDGAFDQLAQQLGGDPFTADGWRALGLDPTRPVILALGRSTGPDVLARAGDRDPLVPGGARPSAKRPAAATILVDLRVIVPVADPAAAARAISRAHTLAPALVFGAPARTLAIDLVVPAAAATADEIAAARPALLAARSTPNAVRARLADPTAGALTGPAPIALHVVPLRLAETLLWLRIGAQSAAPSPEGLADARDAIRPISNILAGPLGNLGVAIAFHGDTAQLAATWEVAPRSPLAAALARTIDSGLPRPADTPGAALHVHSYLADVDALAALPTSGMTYDLPSGAFFPFGGLSPLIDILAAPYAVGATLAHVDGVEPRATPLFAGIRDAVLVVSSIGDDFDHSDGAVEVALTADTAPELRRITSVVWGDGATDRGVTAWGAGRIRAFARQQGKTPTIGAAIRDSAPAYLALTRTSPAAPKDLVLEVHAAPAALALLDPIGALAGTLDLTARWDRGALAIDATLAPP